jgi:phosphatidylserine/phosphatidylglycerophosphate/cardiolipin synthase-like enzyme
MRKKLKFLYLTIIFIIFFSLPVLALPTQDVELITDREYFQVVHQALKKATQSIQVMMYKIGYYEKYPDSPSNILIKDLIDASGRGVEVKVILDISDWNRKVTRDNKNTGRILSKYGIEVEYDPLSINTHAKLVIIDGIITILGSTNWTYYSLAHNNEVSVLIKSKEVAKELSDYFQRIWKTCQQK